jgi:hypothetical protein
MHSFRIAALTAIALRVAVPIIADNAGIAMLKEISTAI